MTASIRDLFLEAIENHGPAQWPAFLDTVCSGDEGLRAVVERLLDAQQRLDGFLTHTPVSTIAASPPEPSTQVGTTIANYKLIEKLGEGGMGIVYVAEQSAPLRRKVALKIIKPGMDSRQVIARFESERQVLALMEHPNIAKVLDAGATDSGHPFFVMELVLGQPITTYCDEAFLTLQQRLAVLVSVCQAVQHAHQKGIIHRDLKPSNILVSMQDGLPVAKVIDFGVAKAVEQQSKDTVAYTSVSQMIGTPLYMSPEQAELRCVDVDTRSDVYSLGSVMYELLTGYTPFDIDTLKSAGFDEMRRILREQQPPLPSQRLGTLGAEELATIAKQRSTDPRRLVREVRGELDWIVFKAIEKDRTRRYSSAQELAEDIQRHLADIHIRARPPSLILAVQRWRRRHPVVAVTAVACLILLLAVLVGGYWHNLQLERSLAVSDGLRKASEAREVILNRELLSTNLSAAWQAATAGDCEGALRLLERHAPNSDKPDDPGFAWHYLRKYCAAPLQTWETSGDLLSADVSPDEHWLASADRQGAITIWDLKLGTPPSTIRYGTQEVNSIRFSPDGTYLAMAGQDRTIRLWDTRSGKETAQFTAHTATVCSLDWSPDSRWLASGGRDNQVHIWDVTALKLNRTLPLADVVRCVVWSPDGRWLAATDGAKGMQVWQTDDWRLRCAPIGLKSDNSNSILAAAFSPDSQLLAYGGYGGSLRIFDVEKNRERGSTHAGYQVSSLAFASPRHLMAGTTDGDVVVLEIPSSEREPASVRKLQCGAGWTRNIIAPPQSEVLWVVNEQSGTIKTWNCEAVIGRSERRFSRPLVSFLPVPGLALTRKEDCIYVERLSDSSLLAKLPFATNHVSDVDPKGNQLAVQESTGRICLWDIGTWKPRKHLSPPPTPISHLRFSGDGRWLAAGCAGGACGAWNTETGAWEQWLPEGTSEYAAVACSPADLRFAAALTDPHSIWLGQLAQAPGLLQLQPQSIVQSLAFSPDGKILAASHAGKEISLWEASSGRSIGVLRGHTDSVYHIAFSPDGSTIVSGSADHTVRLWSILTQRELFSIARLEYAPWWVGFLSDRQVAVATQEGRQLFTFDAD